jgi:hypothetical protein
MVRESLNRRRNSSVTGWTIQTDVPSTMLEVSALGNANSKTEETSELEKSNVAQESQAALRLSLTVEKVHSAPVVFEKHPSGAKAHVDIAAFAARLKSCPFKAISLFAAFSGGRRRAAWLPASVALLFLGVCGGASLFAQAGNPQAAPLPVLARYYHDGEKIGYTISCLNHSRSKTEEYEARAEGVASKDQAGIFVERFAWTDLQLNDQQVRLSDASRAFREPLSLAPGSKLGFSELGKVQAGLIAPITDLLTFYADVKISMNQKGLARAGDHAYVNFAKPTSWADGTKVIVGEDSIDFAIVLQSIDQATQTATLVVRHVPPEQPQLKLPARWMATPVGASQNNWVQVEKTSDGKYVAGVGQETFDVEVKLALASGRILSATLDNPVEVMERVCTDAALTACGDPERYSIRRQIRLTADPTPAQGPSK